MRKRGFARGASTLDTEPPIFLSAQKTAFLLGLSFCRDLYIPAKLIDSKILIIILKMPYKPHMHYFISAFQEPCGISIISISQKSELLMSYLQGP